MTSSRLPWPVVAVCITPGVVIIALAIPLWLRRVKPNLFYGVRFESTLADERVWYEINARGGRHLVVIGVFYLAMIFVAIFFGQSWSVGLRVIGPIVVLAVAVVIDAIILGASSRRLLARLGANPASRSVKSRRM